ncbi:hypothetical protein V2J09_012473 [Rumex salicifolius]
MRSSVATANPGGWTSAIFIIAVEMAERFAYYGVAGNLIIYLTTELRQPLAEAAKNVNSWNGALSLCLLIGAFLTDSFLGRFRAAVISTSIFLMGLSLLTLSVWVVPDHIRPAIFFTALYIIAVGDGGHRPSVQTFAADQFDETTPEERKAKSSFFNYWFLGIVIGSLTSVLVVIYVQDNVSWAVGFAIPTAMEAVALVVFLIGSRKYRKQRPVGSPFTKVAQVFAAAFNKRRVDFRYGGGKVYDEIEVKPGLDGKFNRSGLNRTNQFRFLDKATVIDDIDSSSKTRNPWRLCSVTEVEEVKLVLRLVPVWLCSLAYALIVAQTHTFFIKQGSTMDRFLGSKFQIPPASLQVIPGLIILLFVPIYDKLVVPYAIKLTGNPYGVTPLQRIGVGIALSVLTIVIAALVEVKRLNIAAQNGLLDDPKATVPMSIWWLVPQFLINGLSDVFAYVGLQQLFYDQMPEEMRSVGSALTNAAAGVGALASTVMISVVQGASSKWGKEEWLVSNLNRAHLNYYYWVLAVFCTVDLGVYIVVARWFKMKKLNHGGVV